MDREDGFERFGAEASEPLGEVGGDPVLAALAAVRAATAELKRVRLWSRSDAAARLGVREGFVAVQALQAAWLGLVADLDSRPEAVPGARAGTVAQTFLRAVLLRTGGQAAADVRAAHALSRDADPGAGGLPLLGEAFASGAVSREHVDVALRTLRKLPRRVLSEPVAVPEPAGASSGGHASDSSTPGTPDGSAPEQVPDDVASDNATSEATPSGDSPPSDFSSSDSGSSDFPSSGASAGTRPDGGEMSAGAAVDAFFAEHCRSVTPFEARMLSRSLLERLDPDGQDGFDPEAVERRGLSHSTDAGGMVVGNFQLDPVTGAWFSTAIEHFSAPDPTVMEATEDGGTVPVRDVRSASQRRADALGLISRLALGSEEAGTAQGGEPPRIVVHAGVDDVLDALRGSHREPDAGSPRATVTPPESTGVDLGAPRSSVPETSAPETSTQETSAPETSAPEMLAQETPSQGTPTHETSVPVSSVPAPSASGECGLDSAVPGPDSPRNPQQQSHLQGASGRLGHRGATCAPLGPIGPRLLGRFGCDALLQKVLLSTGGAVLDLGRETRTVTRSQRRALNARDRGCVIPGCSAPPSWCEAHHVIWWRNGGRTDIGQLALTCGRDHTLIHLGIWELVMINGVPWARPPEWIDPLRRLTRNTLHQRADQARALGTQLQLALPPDPDRSLPLWVLPRNQEQPDPPPRDPFDPDRPRADSSHPEPRPPPDDSG
jgi:hypothetical protein